MTTDDEVPAVFTQLPIEHRAALLANPYAPLPQHLVRPLLAHIVSTRWDGGPDVVRLQQSAARALEDERLRLDQWWERRSEAERAALIEHRGGQLPGELRPAVMDHVPGGVAIGDGRDFTGPFAIAPMMAAYVEMVARRRS